MKFLKRLIQFGFAGRAHQSRAPRVQLTSLHEVSFAVGDLVLELANLSTSGMGVYYDSTTIWAKDAVIQGALTIDQTSFGIRVQVKHLSDRIAGCQFLEGAGESPHELKRAIESHLRVEILAMTLVPIEAPQEPDALGQIFWFSDGGSNELFCVVDDQGVIAFRLNFFGNQVEGGRDPKRNERNTDIYAIDPEMAPIAAGFAEHVEQLPALYREQIVTMILSPDN